MHLIFHFADHQCFNQLSIDYTPVKTPEITGVFTGVAKRVFLLLRRPVYPV
jgi:hypothetical protein